MCAHTRAWVCRSEDSFQELVPVFCWELHTLNSGCQACTPSAFTQQPPTSLICNFRRFPDLLPPPFSLSGSMCAGVSVGMGVGICVCLCTGEYMLGENVCICVQVCACGGQSTYCSSGAVHSIFCTKSLSWDLGFAN